MTTNEADYIAGNPAVDPAKLVLITGCSGGGKSTLLAELARRGAQVFWEPGRQIVKEQAFIDGDALPWDRPEDFLQRCLDRAVHQYNSARPGDGCAYFDRGILDAVAGLERLYGRRTPLLQRIVDRYRYATRVFLAPPWPALFRRDAERRHDLAASVTDYEAKSRLLIDYGYELVELPRASVGERADFVLSELR
ncbi:MAG: AAA family ATPase [Pseudomonadota bacterium]